MAQRTLSRWLKAIIIGMAICGLIVFAVIVPVYGKSLATTCPECENRYIPWLVLIWAAGIPCYIALVLAWKIAARIGLDQSFTHENAQCLKWISWLAAGDSALVFAGNLLFWLVGLSHPGVFLMSLLVVFAGIAIAVAAAALSHLVDKAAGLQEESDLTI